MNHTLTEHEKAVLAEIQEDYKALIREAVMARIEIFRERERARKTGEYTQEQLEADERALKAVLRRLRKKEKKRANHQKQHD